MSESTWEGGYRLGFEAGYKAGLLAAARLPDVPQQKIIFEFVKANPGLKSAEIAREAVLNHASVRTALYRLLATGSVKNEHGRWAAVEMQ